MSNAVILDGKALAEKLQKKLAQQISSLNQSKKITPGIGMILMGEDPASQLYVRNKTRQAKSAGFFVRDIFLPEKTSEEEFFNHINDLNSDDLINGFLVQLPLPKHINSIRAIDCISPDKDADGFHVINAGNLSLGRNAIIPATPLGCLQLIHQVHKNLEGLSAVIIGRSNTVGKPMAQLLLQQNCTVTLVHSHTLEIEKICSTADIIVAAAGKPEIVRKNWVKPGATVIDVGINRLIDNNGNKSLVGDVAFSEVSEIAGAITPVPGGVGPMTIVSLLQNTLKLTYKKFGIDELT